MSSTKNTGTPKRYCLRLIGDKERSGAVLCTDGTWTYPGNCMMREFGAVMHIPRLFDTKREAQTQRWRVSGSPSHVEIAEYTWARKPWERECSIIKAAVDRGYAALSTQEKAHG